MTSVRFVGDLPLWAGALVAVLFGLGLWRFYRREAHDLPGRLRWLLPALRAAAVILTILVLTSPVLHHREVIGQLGRVWVFLDSSQSMGTTDLHMPMARKLLVAQQQGWLPAGLVDLSPWEAAGNLAQARHRVETQLKAESGAGAALNQIRNDFAGQMNRTANHIEQFDWHALPPGRDGTNVATWGDISQRFRSQVVDTARKIAALPLEDEDSRLDCTRRLLETCTLTVVFETELLDAFDQFCSHLIDSNSPALTSALTLFDETSRWRRAEASLLDASSGLLGQLTRTHDIELISLSDLETEKLWDPQVSDKPPRELNIGPSASTTDLASGIVSNVNAPDDSGAAPSQPSSTGQRSAVVLMTDGRHNSGASPIQAARMLGDQEIPVLTVGFGSNREPPDLALLDIDHPDLVFQKDRIRGVLSIKDQMPTGTSFVVQISHQDKVLWQEQLTSQDIPLRRIPFELSVDELVEQLRGRFDTQVRYHAMPLSLTASITPVTGETDSHNNESPMRFAAITQSYKLLLLDGRARWETRYIRNVFQRDEQWDIDTVLVGPGTDHKTLPRSGAQDTFPSEKTALLDYDLIIFGDVSPEVFADHERAWIREFVERRGGGIVFIDGRSGYLQQLNEETLRPLIPVSWLPDTIGSLPNRLQLTDQGATQDALMLEITAAANRDFWHELPVPHRIVPVQALPGTEVFVEAVVGGKTLPVLVTRTFGAGRVLYSACDESWRWRYKAADTYHQRFWNQIAKWVMGRPFAVSDQYVSLDSGPLSYATGESADIRVRLRDVEGRPLNDVPVDALLWQDGQIAATIGLTGEETGNGVYRGRSGALPEGEYEVSVRAAGFSNEAMKARTSFVVRAPTNDEMRQLACNDNLLREMATASDGRFLREEQIGQLPELLEPLSSGHAVETDTLLWQSYWWFAAIIGLLAMEWILRKRAGLL